MKANSLILGAICAAGARTFLSAATSFAPIPQQIRTLVRIRHLLRTGMSALRAVRIMPVAASRCALAAALCLPALAHAQSGGPFDLSWSTIDGGGGTSSGGQFTVSGTAGQPDAGTLSGGQFSVTGGFWSFLSVVQTSGAPLLKIKLVGTNAVVSWPLSVTGFSLQETTNVKSGPWSATPQSVVDTATEHTVTVPANGVVKVFRLKK